MSLVEALKQSGFKPEKSTEGEFQPFDGIYKVQLVKVDQKKSDKTGEKQLVCEFKIVEALAGKDSFSKFNEFKKYLALEGEQATDKKKGVPFIINALFTAGYEVKGETDEALLASIIEGIGTELYFRAYGFKPEDAEKAYQLFTVMKEDKAKKRAEEINKKNGSGF